MRTRRNQLTALVLLLAVPVAYASEIPSGFTLGKYVPGDSWMIINTRNNPEAQFIQEHWDRVVDALATSGIGTDVKKLIMDLIPPENRPQADEISTKFLDLIGSVHWDALFGGEFMFAERIRFLGGAAKEMMPDYILLSRPKGGDARQLAESLAALMEYGASQSDKFSVIKAEQKGATTWTLPVEAGLFEFVVLQRDDVVGLIFGGPAGPADVLDLLAGESVKRSAYELDRVRDAVARVQKPEDGLLYFDIKMLMTEIKGLMDIAVRSADADDPDERKGIMAVRKAMDMFDFVDYVVVSIETDGRRQTEHSLALMQEGYASSPAARAFLQRRKFDNFAEFIPKEATSFSATGFVDIPLLYRTAMEFLVNDFPGGQKIVDDINGGLASIGFNPEQDIFSWWSGEMISYSMPSPVVTPMGGQDWMFMIRVSNAKLAAEKVNHFIDWGSSKLAEHNQQLLIQPSPVEGFREVTHPMMMMFLKPHVGVHGDWLMIASSGAVLQKSIAVSKGDAPSVLKNERFQAEGVIPDGPVNSIAFQDLTNLGQELAGAITMIGFAGNMAMGSMPQNSPDDARIKSIMQRVFAIVTKLGPVVQKIDFFSSSASVTQCESTVCKTTSVTTYKEPKPAQREPAKPETTEPADSTK